MVYSRKRPRGGGRKFNKSSVRVPIPSGVVRDSSRRFEVGDLCVSRSLLRETPARTRPSSANSDKLLLTRRAGQTLATPLYLDRVEPPERRENTKEGTQNARRAATRRDETRETRGRAVSRRRYLDVERNRIMSSSWTSRLLARSCESERRSQKRRHTRRAPAAASSLRPLDARQ